MLFLLEFHKLLEANRHLALKMYSIVHDGFIGLSHKHTNCTSTVTHDMLVCLSNLF